MLLSRPAINFNTTGETLLDFAAAAGNFSFSYTTSGSPSAAYMVGGNSFTPTGSGTISNVPLTAGQTFGFSLNSLYSSSAGSLTISNFTASLAIPEPGAGTWLAAGAVGLLAARTMDAEAVLLSASLASYRRYPRGHFCASA